MRLALVLLLLSGCGSLDPRPASRFNSEDIAYTHRIAAVWYEVRDGRINDVCRSVLPAAPIRRGVQPPLQNRVVGCHYWDGSISHIFTPIIRTEAELRILGHEIAHDPRIFGRFHNQEGNWVLKR